ncbi:MAG: DinB family protein [Chloroflexales bacterium]|nr:DinB family protein [Chloroflexales bacterium]
MNQLMSDYFPLFHEYQALRDELLASLSDSDLAFTPGGTNPSLGSLCREIGETERIYIDSIKNRKMDFSGYGSSDAALAQSVQRLKAWYAELDAELRATLEGLSDDDLMAPVDRGGWSIPIRFQVDVYKEALLLFYGKADVYGRTQGKTPSERWRQWVG